jgi:hypothetical protein
MPLFSKVSLTATVHAESLLVDRTARADLPTVSTPAWPTPAALRNLTNADGSFAITRLQIGAIPRPPPRLYLSGITSQ